MIFPKLGLLMSLALGLSLGLGLSSGACAKDEAKSGANAGSPLPAKEAERGLKACQAYAARICECAKNHPDMEEECALANSRPEAFELNLGLAETAGLTDVELKAVKFAARQIAAACFEDDGKLDAAKCPRPD